MEVFKILNGHENIDLNIFSKIMTCERPRGIGFMLVKCQMLGSILFPEDR